MHTVQKAGTATILKQTIVVFSCKIFPVYPLVFSGRTQPNHNLVFNRPPIVSGILKRIKPPLVDFPRKTPWYNLAGRIQY